MAERQETKAVTIALPPSAPKPLLMLVLLADTPIPTVREKYGTYHAIFTTLFARSAALATSEQEQEQEQHEATTRDVSSVPTGHELTIESYDAVHEILPSEQRVKQADAVLITGSASSAYDNLPWISKLVSFTASLPTLNPAAKLFGICFGHQIIARAFGSTVESSERGWEIGVRSLDLTNEGKKIFGGDKLTIHQMHRDHVPSLPNGFDTLGSTPDCPIHGMVRYSAESSSRGLRDVSVITVQGHPEFTPDMVQKIIDAREQGGVISSQVAAQSREYARMQDQGVEIGRVFLQILGVE